MSDESPKPPTQTSLLPDLVPARPELPGWYTPRKYARRERKLVELGLHPLGATLISPWSGERCGTCAHRVAVDLWSSRTRCRKLEGVQHAEPRERWRACVHYEANESAS